MIKVGENLGLTKIRIRISVRKIVIAYFSIKNSPLRMTASTEISIIKNSNPAAALIFRSFKTGMLYSSTSSHNFSILFVPFSIFFNEQ